MPPLTLTDHQEKLEARASRILYEWHGPHELLLETTKLHRRREEFRINGDHLDIAPEWDDLPPEPESAARTPAFCNDAFFRRPPHMVFFIARTVYRPRTFSSQFPRMWGGCHHTPTDLYRDALVHSLVELVFPSPAEVCFGHRLAPGVRQARGRPKKRSVAEFAAGHSSVLGAIRAGGRECFWGIHLCICRNLLLFFACVEGPTASFTTHRRGMRINRVSH